MKKEDMLRQMGDINEKFIEEADREPVRVVSNVNRRKVNVRKWGRWAAGIAAAFVIFAGCNAFLDSDFLRMGADKETSSNVDNGFGIMGMTDFDEGDSYQSAPMEDLAGNSFMEESKEMSVDIDQSVDNKRNAGVKLIYNADVNVQTVDFEATTANLKEFVEAHGGYIESANVDNGSYGDIDYCKDGNYVIRIPQGEYRAFIEGLNENFNIRRLNESVEDIGEAYFDTEARIQTLRIKQERLQDMLKQATNISDVIEIENALTDTEYQLEMYTSTLKRYDSLVGYSTVTIWVQEVEHLGNSLDSERGFFSSIAYALKSGVINFIDFIKGLTYNIAYNIISIIIVVVIVIVCWKKKVFSRIVKLFDRNKRL